MKKLSVSLLISTYNWPEALEMTILSALSQSVLPSEIIIADDGSKEPTRELVRHYTALSPVPMVHIWQEDTGFRLSAIRNKAIAAAKSQYIIQVDGDVVLHHHFIRDHISNAKPGYMVSGSRVMVGEVTSAKMIANKDISLSIFAPGLRNRGNRLYCPPLALLFKGYHPNKVKGCNMAYWREDIIKVNGYDEQIEGWGWEDIELAIRMKSSGIGKHTLKYVGAVYHLYHKEASRTNADKNRAMQQKAAAEQRTMCEKGINQYL